MEIYKLKNTKYIVKKLKLSQMSVHSRVIKGGVMKIERNMYKRVGSMLSELNWILSPVMIRVQ